MRCRQTSRRQSTRAGVGSGRAKSGRKATAKPRAESAEVGLIGTREVRKLANKLARMSLPEREAVPGIGPRRAEIIVAGAQVIAEILETFGFAGYRY